MTDKEYQVYLETRLRNLRRRYSRLSQHAELKEEAIETLNQINLTEKELSDAMT